MFRQKFFKVSLALILAGNTFISTAANHYAEEVAEQEMSVPQDEEKKDDGKIDDTVTSSPENNEEQLPEKIPEKQLRSHWNQLSLAKNPLSMRR